jgi:hypothetical protein
MKASSEREGKRNGIGETEASSSSRGKVVIIAERDTQHGMIADTTNVLPEDTMTIVEDTLDVKVTDTMTAEAPLADVMVEGMENVEAHQIGGRVRGMTLDVMAMTGGIQGIGMVVIIADTKNAELRRTAVAHMTIGKVVEMRGDLMSVGVIGAQMTIGKVGEIRGDLMSVGAIGARMMIGEEFRVRGAGMQSAETLHELARGGDTKSVEALQPNATAYLSQNVEL